MIPLFVWTPTRNVPVGEMRASAAAARILGDSGWIITALLYVAIIASILFAFIQVFTCTSGICPGCPGRPSPPMPVRKTGRSDR
jgi:hypothetical protein